MNILNWLDLAGPGLRHYLSTCIGGFRLRANRLHSRLSYYLAGDLLQSYWLSYEPCRRCADGIAESVELCRCSVIHDL